MRRIWLAVIVGPTIALLAAASGVIHRRNSTPQEQTVAQQAQKTPKVALLFIGTPEAEISGANPKSAGAKGFLEGLRELGWIDGQNIAIERRSALGDPDRYLVSRWTSS